MPLTLKDVVQDGADFYTRDGHVWSAPFKVKDFDMSAAKDARLAFEQWAAHNHYAIEWEK